MAKIDPITEQLIDIMTLGKGTVQVASHKGKWFSKLFSDAEAAIDWRNSFDIVAASIKGREETDFSSQRVRLVGDGWSTVYMSKEVMALWLHDRDEVLADRVKPAPAPAPAPAPKKSHKKKVVPLVETQNAIPEKSDS